MGIFIESIEWCVIGDKGLFIGDTFLYLFVGKTRSVYL